ncbi:MAG: hypothetical protein GY871_04300 [Actinomycetales bacterium]|nr:hypothetical protein [Actinomycetales bacterium]
MAWETVELNIIGLNLIRHERDNTIGAHRVVLNGDEGDAYPVSLVARNGAAGACAEEYIDAYPADLTAPPTTFVIET